MDRPSPELVNCPHCGLKMPAIEEACASCGKNLAIFIGPRPKAKTFRLADAMWWIAAFAVCFGLLRAEPVCGVVLSVLVLPALLRTTLSIAERKLDERPMNRADIAATFCLSLAVVFFIVFTTLFVVIATATMVLQSDQSSTFQVGLSIALVALAGCATAIVMARTFWPRRD